MMGTCSGMYILLADDTEAGYHTDNAAWQPLLHPYQQVSRLCPIFTNRSQTLQYVVNVVRYIPTCLKTLQLLFNIYHQVLSPSL